MHLFLVKITVHNCVGISFDVFKLMNNISTVTEVGKLCTKLIVVSMPVLCKLVIEFGIDWVAICHPWCLHLGVINHIPPLPRSIPYASKAHFVPTLFMYICNSKIARMNSFFSFDLRNLRS